MAKSETMVQVKSGFRIAGAWLLGFGWLCLVLAGMAVAVSPSKYPPVVGWLLLAVAAIILVTTAQRWVKALPGLLGLATLNALFSIFSGHATNLPSVPISRSESLVATLLLVVSTALSPSFTARELRVVDRLAFLIYASCIFWGAVDHRVTLPVQMGIATFCLLSAWVYDRLQRRRGHNLPGHDLGGPAGSPVGPIR
jgi:hypothetical protein